MSKAKLKFHCDWHTATRNNYLSDRQITLEKISLLLKATRQEPREQRLSTAGHMYTTYCWSVSELKNMISQCTLDLISWKILLKTCCFKCLIRYNTTQWWAELIPGSDGQQYASGFGSYGNYPREVTAPSITCWGTMSHACRAISLPHESFRINQSHCINIEHVFLQPPPFPRYLLSLCHCSLSPVVPLHLLFTKKTVTNLAIHPHWNFSIGLHGRSVSLYNPHGIMGRFRKLASIQSGL